MGSINVTRYIIRCILLSSECIIISSECIIISSECIMTRMGVTRRMVAVRTLLSVLVVVVVTSLCVAVVVRTEDNSVVDNNRFLINNRLHQVYWKHVNNRNKRG